MSERKKSLAECLFEDLLEADKTNAGLQDQTQPMEETSSIDSKNNEENSINISNVNIINSVIPVKDSDDDDDDNDNAPLSVLQNLKLLKKMKKCRVKLRKIGKKKLLQVIQKPLKINKKKNNIKNSLNESNEKNEEIVTPKKTIVRLSRVDLNLSNQSISPKLGKRKSTESSIQSPKPKKKSPSQTKIFIKLDSPQLANLRKTSSPTNSKKSPRNKKSLSPALKQIKSIKKQPQKTIDPKLFTKANLQETFGPQFFKCRVRLNKVRSLNNLNVTDIEMELDRKEKRKLRKKAKGLNKSVSFVETVEVFGESDSEDNIVAPDLNKDNIELDASTDENNDGGGGDDGNINIAIDISTEIKKQQLNDEITENGDISENVFKDNDDNIMKSTPKGILNISPGKIGRIRKSFSPLKSEEDQQSPRSKLLRKGDEKIVRISELLLDDDDDDKNQLDEDKDKDDDNELKEQNVTAKKLDDYDNNDDNGTNKTSDNITTISDDDDGDVEIINKENDLSLKSCLDDSVENQNLNQSQQSKLKKSLINEKEDTQNEIVILNEQYESLSSDDSKDFLDTKDNENKSKTTITNIDKDNEKDIIKRIEIDDFEDDDYYLPKPKISENNEVTENKENENINDDDVETIDKIMSTVNEDMPTKTIEKEKCNEGDESNDIFQKVVESIDMLNSNRIPSQSSPIPFGEELKLSDDDENSRNVIEQELREITKITPKIIEKTVINTSQTKTTTQSASSSSPITKFSLNTFLKSSIQTIKTRIMSDSSPKLLNTNDNIMTSSQESQKIISDNNSDDGDLPPQGILLDETDDDESSALLGDPVLGGREMSY